MKQKSKNTFVPWILHMFALSLFVISVSRLFYYGFRWNLGFTVWLIIALICLIAIVILYDKRYGD